MYQFAAELLKQTSNEPILGFSFVVTHIREKGLHNFVSLKTLLLRCLSKSRELVEDRRYDDAEELIAVATERAQTVVDKVSALSERLRIVTDIEFKVQTAEKSKRDEASAQKRKHKLPSGFGQLLDDMLVTGNISADEYALKMAKFVDFQDHDESPTGNRAGLHANDYRKFIVSGGKEAYKQNSSDLYSTSLVFDIRNYLNGKSGRTGHAHETSSRSNTRRQHTATNGRPRKSRNTEDLKSFLRKLGYIKYYDHFKNNQITTVGKVLTLDSKGLEEIGLPEPIRLKIQKEIEQRKARKQSDAENSAPNKRLNELIQSFARGRRGEKRSLTELEKQVADLGPEAQQLVKDAGGMKAYVLGSCQGIFIDSHGHLFERKTRTSRPTEVEQRIISELKAARDGSMKVSALSKKVKWSELKPKFGPITSFLTSMDSVSLERLDNKDFVCRIHPNKKKGFRKQTNLKAFSDDHFIRALVRKIQSADGSMTIVEMKKKLENHPEWQQHVANTSITLEEYLNNKKGTFKVIGKEKPIVTLVSAQRNRSGKSSGSDAKEQQILVRNIPKELGEDSIMEYFSAFGKIVEFRWNTRDQILSLRSCLIEFDRPQVVNSIRNIFDHRIQGHPVEVKTLATGLTSGRKSQPSSPRSGASKETRIKPGVILCAQGVQSSLSDDEIFKTFHKYGIYGLTRVKQKALAFLYMREKAQGMKALDEVHYIDEKQINLGLATRQDGTPNTLSTFAPIISSNNTEHLDLNLNEGEEPKFSLNIGSENAQIWMKEEKMPSEFSSLDNHAEEPSIVSSAQASISRAMETRNEITELIRSVQLDRLMPTAGIPDSGTGRSYLAPTPPSMHQQWIDPLGFNNSFAPQVAQAATENLKDSQDVEEELTGAIPCIDDEQEQFERKRQLESFGTNMGGLGLMQTSVEKAEEKVEIETPMNEVETEFQSVNLQASHEIPKHGSSSSRILQTNTNDNPFELDRGQADIHETIESKEPPKPKLFSSRVADFEPKDQRELEGETVAPGKTRAANLDPFELQVPPSSVKSTVTGIGLSRFDKPSQEEGELQDSSSWKSQSEREELSGTSTSGKADATGLLDRNKRTTVTSSILQKPEQLSNPPKQTSSTWAALTKKQTGVGPRLVSLKSSTTKSQPQVQAPSSAWTDSKVKPGLGGSGLTTLSRKLSAPTSATTLSTLRPAQKALGGSQESAVPAVPQTQPKQEKKFSSLARLAARQEVKNQEFPALSSVKLAEEAEADKRKLREAKPLQGRIRNY